MPLHTCVSNTRQHQSGLTLIELMITLAVLAILLTIAIPSFQSTAAKNRLATSASQLQGALALARTESIRRGTRVTVCTRNGNSCANNATRHWASGWIVFVDGADSGAGEAAGTIDAGDTVIRRYDAAPTGISIQGNANVAWYVSYVASGQAKTIGGAMQIGTIRACTESTSVNNDKRAKDMALNAGGRIAVTVPTGISSSCPAP